MTRKDYEAIAGALKALLHPVQNAGYYGLFVADRDTVEVVAQNIAGLMAADNPRFDRARFLKACGVQS